MQRFCTILAALAALCLGGPTGRANGATLASLVGGGTLETALLKFDAFTYSATGGPAASAINVTPMTFAPDSQGLTITGAFSATTFVQVTIGYRVTGKSGATIHSASLAGNPMAGPSNFVIVNETFSGGLTPLTVFSQSGSTSTSDTNSFPSRSSVNVTTLMQFNGAAGSPSTLSFLDQLFGAATQNGADFDASGAVDGRDFLTWQRNLGLMDAAPSQGDANGDTLVDQLDLHVWKSFYGPVAVHGAAQATPEPGAAALVATAACCVMRLAARRRR